MKKVLLIIIFILSAYNLFAQYNIKGSVIDFESGKPLQGATVLVENTKLGAISDINGDFNISGIKTTKITIRVSFIGYETKEVEYTIKTGKNDILIRLKQIDEQLVGVTVEGESSGQVKAFIEQKRAANIKNVVSSEQIELFPDMNAAEAMQRIPGITLQRDQGEGRYVQLRGTPPELTNFNINGEQIPSPEGNVRYVGMDIISADQIEFIEVTKVLTPDMDADGIAGSINIITKKASGFAPDIKATLAGGYNNLRTTNNYQLQFSYGQRYGNFGFHMSSSYYLNNQGSDNMEFSYAKGPLWGNQGDGEDNYYVQYREVQLRHYDITRQRTGLSATLDYEFDKYNSLYLRGMYNSFSDEENRYRKIYDLDDALSENYYLYGGIDHDVKNREKNQKVNTINFGGENKLLGVDIDYEISYAIASETEPDRLEARFESPGQAVAIKFDRDDPSWPIATYPDEDNAQNAFDYANYDFDELLFENHNVEDNNVTGKINFKIPYLMNKNNKGFFKFGSKVRFKEKYRDVTASSFGAYRETSYLYPGTGDTLRLTGLNDGFQTDNLLNKGYEMSYMPNAGIIRDFYTYNSEFFIIDRTDSKTKSYGQDYHAYEDIYAGYAMVKHDIGKLMLLGGVRYERSDIDYEGRKIVTAKGNFRGMDTLKDTRTHEFILPQFQMKYSINPNFNLRAALTYTYSRPNFEDVLPYREQDREEVKYGNPDLKFPESMNVDLLGERYFNNGAMVLGGLFYKQIDNFIFFYKRFAHEGEDFSDYPLVEIEKAINGIEAFVYGAELQTQFKFDFIEGFFSDFGVYLNYTYTHSEAYINKRISANFADAIVIFGEDDLSLFSDENEQEQITLPGQAMHSSNLAFFYDNGTFYAKISANYHDDFLYELGADKDLDVYYDKAWHLDFNTNYRINENLTVFADIINITNAPLKHYLGTPDRVQKQEFYSWWGRTGVKLHF